jgi:hypothetical protein
MKRTIEIHAIPAPTIDSDARKHELQEAKKHQVLSDAEENELFHLEMRVFWNCEC